MSETLRILVVHASKHGSTREVAEAVASVLREREHTWTSGLRASFRRLDGYDAVVLGAALYMGRLHADARKFLRRRRGDLAARQLRRLRDGARARRTEQELESSRKQLGKGLASVPELEPVATAVFGGVFDPSQLRFPFNRMPAVDARDWDAIRAWADGVATVLQPSPAPVGRLDPALLPPGIRA